MRRAVRWLEARSVPEGTSSRVQRGTRRIPAPLGSPANPLGGAGSPWASAALGAAFFAIYLLLAPAVPGDKDSGEFTLVLATNGVAHPTGYPLFTIFGHGFVRIAHALGASWAYAANAWSAPTRWARRGHTRRTPGAPWAGAWRWPSSTPSPSAWRASRASGRRSRGSSPPRCSSGSTRCGPLRPRWPRSTAGTWHGRSARASPSPASSASSPRRMLQ
ncbi:MAG: DUF2723 domain-containing protein [Candidatus Eisenbacteria bacterium]|uniref:DUF2723 domain-containing protein n=1 Tax=Eiseniibacteriota bacterium TaxID=2212470 RepID=A0A538SQN3_UNCEI|nr:MAG: DUF2723 domain-containing protein [Candidatus Eisenbacteria bacterium]